MHNFARSLIPVDLGLRRASLLMLQAAVCFSLMTVLARQLGQTIDPLFLVWFRGLTGSLLLLLYLKKKKISILGKHRGMLLIRALVGSLGVSLMFLTAKWIPAADAISLIMTSALFVPFVAALVLKEKLDPRVLALVGLGFCGVLLVVQPGFAKFNRGFLYGLATAVVHSMVYTALRGLSSRENPYTVVFYFLAGSALFTLPFLTWPLLNPDSAQILQIFLLCLSGFAGQLLMTQAYAHASAAVVTPYLYSEVVFCALFGWCLIGEVPNFVSLLGMLLICFAGIGIGRLR